MKLGAEAASYSECTKNLVNHKNVNGEVKTSNVAGIVVHHQLDSWSFEVFSKDLYELVCFLENINSVLTISIIPF